jgi:predicted nucleotidyltransferase
MVQDLTTPQSQASSNRIADAQPVIAEATRRLVAEFKPEQVWLFGSYAWGEPTEDSDLDLFVVVSESDDNSLGRAQNAHRALSGLDLPKDVIVKTRAEVDRVKLLKPTLTFKIINEGRLLYGR